MRIRSRTLALVALILTLAFTLAMGVGLRVLIADQRAAAQAALDQEASAAVVALQQEAMALARSARSVAADPALHAFLGASRRHRRPSCSGPARRSMSMPCSSWMAPACVGLEHPHVRSTRRRALARGHRAGRRVGCPPRAGADAGCGAPRSSRTPLPRPRRAPARRGSGRAAAWRGRSHCPALRRDRECARLVGGPPAGALRRRAGGRPACRARGQPHGARRGGRRVGAPRDRPDGAAPARALRGAGLPAHRRRRARGASAQRGPTTSSIGWPRP